MIEKLNSWQREVVKKFSEAPLRCGKSVLIAHLFMSDVDAQKIFEDLKRDKEMFNSRPVACEVEDVFNW